MLLLPASTSERWFRLVFDEAHEVRFIVGRVRFVGGASSRMCGSLLAVYKPSLPPKKPKVSMWAWR